MKRQHTYLLYVFMSCITLSIFATSCNNCAGKEPYEAFDFRIVDGQGDNLVGVLFDPNDIQLTSNGKDLIQGFYEHPENGVVFIFNYKDLSNGEISGLLELGTADQMEVKMMVKQNIDDCFDYNIVEVIKVGNQDYPISSVVVDFIK